MQTDFGGKELYCQFLLLHFQRMDDKKNQKAAPPYRLDDQVGFLMRRATQRHLAIFSRTIDGLTPMQFATMAKLAEAGALSQNALGRLVAMDAATIKGVVDRLGRRGLVSTENDKTDRRRTIVSLSDKGRDQLAELIQQAEEISGNTLAPLSETEQAMFLHLLRKVT